MKIRLWRIICGLAIYLVAMTFPFNDNKLIFGLYMISYLIVGWDVIHKALFNIRYGKVFDENLLMTIATIGAFVIGVYPEGVAVMLFYQTGELFQSYAVHRSRKSIASLMDIRPDYASVKRGEDLVTVDPDEVKIGDIIVIKPGEKVPLDAKVIRGSSMLDTSALTGESVPREVEINDEILSGCINISGLLMAKVQKVYEESTVSKILDLVENATSKKSKSEQFITKFARFYTPIVVILAILLAVIPPLVLKDQEFMVWLYRALSFLVVSCPCALVISIPLSFFGGLGGASRKGILIKGSNYLEALAQTEVIVFDKTGTLTKGTFRVQAIHEKGIEQSMLLELTAYAESYSNHPIADSLKEAYGKRINKSRVKDVKEIPGQGVMAFIDSKSVLVGNQRLMETSGIPYEKGDSIGTLIHVAIDGIYKGYIVIGDEVKEDAKQAIQDLKNSGIKECIILSGDRKSVVGQVGDYLDVDQTYGELLPGDKVEIVEDLLSKLLGNGKLAFVGDGVNDAPVLARADVGIAMGGLGSDAAIEAADVVIMTDEPSKIATGIRIARKTLGIAQQNAFFAIGVKAIVLLLSAIGYTSMWAAVFADVGVTVIAILNSFRALRVNYL